MPRFLLYECARGALWALEPTDVQKPCHYAVDRECRLACNGFPTQEERDEMAQKAMEYGEH